jgi:hypothetical protein
MKHFTQYIQLLRAAWEGDRQRAAEQLLALADQMEGEGDAAHARMLRFTLQALQNHPSARDGHTLMRPAAPTRATGSGAPVLDVDLGTPSPALGSVALTFGTWDETRH